MVAPSGTLVHLRAAWWAARMAGVWVRHLAHQKVVRTVGQMAKWAPQWVARMEQLAGHWAVQTASWAVQRVVLMVAGMARLMADLLARQKAHSKAVLKERRAVKRAVLWGSLTHLAGLLVLQTAS